MRLFGKHVLLECYIIAQKMNFSIKDFFSGCDQICRISGHIC